jgi:hypothetical protein
MRDVVLTACPGVLPLRTPAGAEPMLNLTLGLPHGARAGADASEGLPCARSGQR